MDRIDRAAVYGYRARLPRHRLGLRSRVLVELTCRHSSQSTEIIDLTGDETGYTQPQQAGHLDAVVKMASDIDTSATNEGQANPVGLYCAACNGTIGAQPVLRICGCVSLADLTTTTVLTRTAVLQGVQRQRRAPVERARFCLQHLPTLAPGQSRRARDVRAGRRMQHLLRSAGHGPDPVPPLRLATPSSRAGRAANSCS